MGVKGPPLTHTLLGGALSAILFLSVTLLPNFGTALLSSLAPIPLFMVGLSQGRRPAIVASLITCIAILLASHPIQALSFAILYALPVVILTDRALLSRKTGKTISWYPAAPLLLWLTAIAAVIVAVAVVMISPYSDPERLKESIHQLTPILGPQPEGAIEALGQVLPFFPAFFGFSWCFSMLINSALAQGILVGFKKNLRPSPQLSTLSLPKWLLGVTALTLVLAFLNLGMISQLGANLFPILLVPFSLVGLGFVHRRIINSSSPQFFLILFYAILIFFLWPLLFLAAAGLILTFIEKNK